MAYQNFVYTPNRPMAYTPYYQPNYQPNFQPNYGQQMPMQQPMAQPQNQPQSGFAEVIYATEKEADAFIVPPNHKVLFWVTDTSKIVVKSTDSNGMSRAEKYALTQIDNLPETDQKTQHRANDGVKRDDLSAFMKKDDAQKQFDELKKDFEKQFKELKNTVKINEIMKGEKE